MTFRKRLFWVSIAAILAGIGLGLADYFAEVCEISPEGCHLPDTIFLFLNGLLFFSGFLSVILGLIYLIHRNDKSNGVFLSTGGILFVGVSLLTIRLLPDVRMKAFRDLGERLMPLVHAIQEYHTDTRNYPENLDELVPKYLNQLPETGIRVYDEYEYYVGENAEQDFEGNPWVLHMNASSALQFDRFFYFPKQNYPSHGYGGSIEVLGKWAYVHE